MRQQLLDWLARATTAVRSAIYRIAGSISLGSIVSISWISVWVVICVLVAQDLSRDLVTIEPITTPKTLSEDGYTSEVASRRLHDALNKYAAGARSFMQTPSVKPSDELPDFVVPKIELSLNAIVASIRSALHYGSGQKITGEFISRDKLFLRVRVDGQEVFSGSNSNEDPDGLLAQAAPSIMEKIRPYLVASTLYDTDPELGKEKADEIIARLKELDVNVQWAYILKGTYFIDQKKYFEAEEVLRTAVRLNGNNWVAYLDLGNSLRAQGKIDEAIALYRHAIGDNPMSVLAHNNLATALDAKAKLTPDSAIQQEALSEYRRAIDLDPKYAMAHKNLSLVLARLGRSAEAIAECRRAIDLDPKDASAHFSLGLALRGQNNIDEAIAEYHRAIDLDPKYAAAHNNLGVIFREMQLLRNINAPSIWIRNMRWRTTI